MKIKRTRWKTIKGILTMCAIFGRASKNFDHLRWLSRISNFPRFHKNENSLELWEYISYKKVHQKGLFDAIKENPYFPSCRGILDIYGQWLLNTNIIFILVQDIYPVVALLRESFTFFLKHCYVFLHQSESSAFNGETTVLVRDEIVLVDFQSWTMKYSG